MQIERVNTNELLVNSMPDGSRIIRNPDDEHVFALNATAGAAWDACASSNTLQGIAEEMRRSFDPGVTDDLAEASVLELEKKNLVTISGADSKTTRRQVLAGLGAVALPLVVSLTVGEQKAHAERALSCDRKPHASVPKSHKLNH